MALLRQALALPNLPQNFLALGLHHRQNAPQYVGLRLDQTSLGVRVLHLSLLLQSLPLLHLFRKGLCEELHAPHHVTDPLIQRGDLLGGHLDGVARGLPQLLQKRRVAQELGFERLHFDLLRTNLGCQGVELVSKPEVVLPGLRPRDLLLLQGDPRVPELLLELPLVLGEHLDVPLALHDHLA